MASEFEMGSNEQANESTDHHGGNSACRDIQLVPTQLHKYAYKSIPATSFHRFSELPWELRRAVWSFALPRSVFVSTILKPTDCVPYPPMGHACREARLVAKEFGSMVTAWSHEQVLYCWQIWSRPENEDIHWPEDIPNETDMCVRTWFSSKLDTLVLNAGCDEFPYWREEHDPCDFIDFIKICQSPSTHLVIQDDSYTCTSDDLEYLYQTHLRDRTEVLLCIKELNLNFKDQALEVAAGLNISRRPGNRTQVIRLDDTVALTNCVQLRESLCNCEKKPTCKAYCSGKWFDTAVDEAKRAENDWWMRRYEAWVVEDQAFEERLVSPEAHFLLQTVDSIISSHVSIRNTGRGSCCRGHELMDDTGRLKEDHPLVQELDIKLPQVIPVFTISLSGGAISECMSHS